jgi:tetratricopeptide (TPR) repeat protein
MSPLLDALRRAEEERRGKEGKQLGDRVERRQNELSSRTPQENLSLAEPVAPVATPPKADNASDLALEDFPPLDMERVLAAAKADRSRPRNRLASAAPVTKVVPQAEREATRNESAAKSSAKSNAKPPAKAKATPGWLLPVIAVAVTLLGVGGWYVWNEINRPSRPFVAATPRPQAPLAAALPTTGQVGSAVTASPTASEAVLTPALPPLLPPISSAAPVRPQYVAPIVNSPRLSPREVLAKTLGDAPVARDDALGLRLAASPVASTVNPELLSAYQALSRADYSSAEKQYAKLVLAEPQSIDAQLGLATVYARAGSASAASRHYRQVLALDPRNGLAITGLLALSDGAPPANLEIELKTLIGRHPDAAPLHFSLGNLYASQQRWTEAQQAFFDAFRVEPNNADFLFNLAVSLDHLRQYRLALDYYRKAAAAVSVGGSGQFDRGVVQQRIIALSSAPTSTATP